MFILKKNFLKMKILQTFTIWVDIYKVTKSKALCLANC